MTRKCFWKSALPVFLFIAGSHLALDQHGSLGIHKAEAGITGKISGTVRDAKTREPLPGVNLVLEGTTQGAASDAQGDYFIANVPPGTYTLKVSLLGYAAVTVTGVRVRVDATTELNFALEETTIELGEEVTVVAQRPLVEKDNTSSSVVIETSEIAARPTVNFTEILATLPSINVDNGVMTVRGGALEQVAFMVDGARARNPLDHSPYTSINLSAIQELEVITGSFNAEYGEAQSGVINVITREGSDKYEFFLDARYTPPGKKHWGTALYDRDSDLYWENSHARHLQWWIDYPDQWVDPNGIPGSNPGSIWTPEQAHQNYLDTHQPLTDYTETPSYQTEVGFGGPLPALKNFYFFTTGRFRSEAPLFGNSFRDKGRFFDGTLKLTYKFKPTMSFTLSGFLGKEETSWGIGGQPDYFYAQNFGIDSRYAYYDFPALPESQTEGLTLKFTHVLNAATLYELKVSRVHAFRKTDVFPGDPLGFQASDATRDNLRAVDANGNPIPGGYANRVGYHTVGYFYRFNDQNTEWTLSGFASSQLNKYWQLKGGLEFTDYHLDHFNKSKLPDRTDDNTYHPYQGALYAQNKVEFGGLIMNLGLRYDFYNPNNVVYTDLFDPLNSATEKSKLFSQLSPRLGFSHPIDERTALHFSYGHFFQRAPFGDYGEGNSASQALGSLTTFIVDGTNVPWVLGNRNLKPEKTIAYEVGIERNFANAFVLDVTGYYKDIRNTIRVTTVESPQGVYRTNSNGDYADVRGGEISLRKLPAHYGWGSLSGYVNFTAQRGISGRSGDPTVITPGGVRYAPSGDFIVHNNPRLKAGLFYETPDHWNFAGGIFKDILFSLDYQAVFPNENLLQDFFTFEGRKHMRPADQTTNLRIKKEAKLPGNVAISPYVEVHNLLNQKWINLAAFENTAPEEQRKFVESGFDYLPARTRDGVPIMDTAKYRNLPRAILFGASLAL